MSASESPQCPECDTVMVLGKRPLMRIFGDVGAFECSNCEYMLFVERQYRQATTPEPGFSANSIEAAE